MNMKSTERKARIKEMNEFIKNTPIDQQFKSFPDRVHFGIEMIGLMIEDVEEHRTNILNQRQAIIAGREAIFKLNPALPLDTCDKAISDYDTLLKEVDENLSKLKVAYDKTHDKLKLIE